MDLLKKVHDVSVTCYCKHLTGVHITEWGRNLKSQSFVTTLSVTCQPLWGIMIPWSLWFKTTSMDAFLFVVEVKASTVWILNCKAAVHSWSRKRKNTGFLNHQCSLNMLSGFPLNFINESLIPLNSRGHKGTLWLLHVGQELKWLHLNSLSATSFWRPAAPDSYSDLLCCTGQSYHTCI